MRQITFSQATLEAMAEEMRRDERIFVMGEDIVRPVSYTHLDVYKRQFIYRTITIKDLYQLMVDSALGSAIVMFIVACAGFFAWFITTQGIAQMASNLLLTVAGNKFMFLIIINIILLIAGCFIEANSALYIFTPIMLPVALAPVSYTHLDVYKRQH